MLLTLYYRKTLMLAKDPHSNLNGSTMPLNTPEFVFTEQDGARQAHLARPEDVSYEAMVDDLAAVYESITIGDLRENLTTAIVDIVGSGRGFIQVPHNMYQPNGTLFAAKLSIEDSVTLHNIRMQDASLDFPKNYDGTTSRHYSVSNNNFSTNYLDRPTVRLETCGQVERRLALQVINSLATAIHERGPGFDVDERIFVVSPLLFSELIASN